MTDDKSLTSTVGIGRLSGSFWTETYGNRAQPEALFEAVAETAKQFAVETQEALDAVSRQKVHPYRRERWFPLILKSSELNTTEGSLLHYGEDAVYGPQPDGTRYQYGVSRSTFYIFPIPAGLKRCQYVSNRINTSGRCWLFGVDVLLDLDQEVLVFKDNPLTDPNVAPDVTDTDQIATLWLCDAEFDRQDVYNQYGFVHGFSSQQDSELQKPAVLAVAEAIVTGTNMEDFTALLEAGTGIGRTLVDETVVEIATDARGTFLATDRAVYRIPAGSNTSYVVGDVIPANEFVTDDVMIRSFSQPLVPSWFRALGLSPGITAVGIAQGLTLYNDDVPVKVDRTQDPPYVSFDVGGTAESAKAFFTSIYARFKAAGLSFWDALQDEYGANPTTINPLTFFIKHWFRGSLLVVRLAGPALQSRSIAHLPFVKRLVPPHTLLVILADLQPPKQKFTIPANSIDRFLGGDIQQAKVTIGSARISIRYVATNCE